MDVNELTNINKFRFICKDLPSPDLFIDFNFYFLVASCLARKVWVGTDGGWQLYPNQYIWIVGDPGLGKSLPSIAGARILKSLTQLRKIKVGDKEETRIDYLVNLAANTTSWEKLIKSAVDSGTVCKRIDNPEKTRYYHASTTFCLAGELGTLFRKNTDDIGTFLTEGWDCGDYKNDTYKHGLQIIKNICINFLGCLAPEKMKKLENQEILDEGLAARILFLFAHEGRKGKPALFNLDDRQLLAQELLANHLKNLCLLPASEIKLSLESAEWIEDWHKNRSHLKINKHPKLSHYYARKKQHIIKLAMCTHFADKLTYEIEINDFENALKLLEQAEINMHEARCCGGKNPISVIANLIEGNLKNMGPMSRTKLYVEHFHEGNEMQINEALNFLQTAGKIEPVEVGGKAGFKYNGNNEL